MGKRTSGKDGRTESSEGKECGKKGDGGSEAEKKGDEEAQKGSKRTRVKKVARRGSVESPRSRKQRENPGGYVKMCVHKKRIRSKDRNQKGRSKENSTRRIAMNQHKGARGLFLCGSPGPKKKRGID